MSKISEQKALKEYPEALYIGYPDSWSRYKTLREGYIVGYDQAMKDFLEKACDYLKRNYQAIFDTYTEKGYNEIEKFKEYIES